MKHKLAVVLVAASLNAVAGPSSNISYIEVGGSIQQSGDNCVVTLQYLEPTATKGVQVPVRRTHVITQSCRKLIAAGLLTGDMDNLAFSKRANAMRASEFIAAASDTTE